MSLLANELRHELGGNRPSNYIDGLLDLIHYTAPNSVIEIGSHRGVSTEVFLKHCRHVTAVDPWPDEDVYKAFMSRCGYYPNLKIIRGESPNDIPMPFYPVPELCYIDGLHDFEHIVADIAGAKRMPLRWIAGHDWHYADVRNAVHIMLGIPERVFSDTSWVIRL